MGNINQRNPTKTVWFLVFIVESVAALGGRFRQLERGPFFAFGAIKIAELSVALCRALLGVSIE